MTMRPPTTSNSVPTLKILLVCDRDSHSAVPALPTCHRLAKALAAESHRPLVLHHWPATTDATESPPSARVQNHPYPIYCSRSVVDDIALLSLIEQPTLAITLGPDPVALAQPLLASGVPCLAWLLDAPSLQAVPHLTNNHQLGLAAAGEALAAQATALVGHAVHTLLPPVLDTSTPLKRGTAVLVPSTRRIDGVQRALELARARPQWPFVLVGEPAQLHSARALLAPLALPNVSVMDIHQAATMAYRTALLPALSGDLPWDTLAWCLAQGLPVLGSTEALLEETLGTAGVALPVTRVLDAWLEALDRLMLDDVVHAVHADAAQARGASLRLPAPQSAGQCLQVALRHLRASGHRVSPPP